MRLTVLMVLAASACNTYDEHHIEAFWSIDRYGTGAAITADGLPGTDIGCPAGWDTVRLIAVDPSAPASRSVDTFACDAQQGTSSYLPADSYVAWLEVADGSKVLAASPPTTTEVTSFGPQLLADIYVDAGYATVAWPPVADPVIVELAGATTVSTYFNGSDATGLIGPLPQGRYQATATIGDGVQTLPDLVITAPNGLADLGTLAAP